MGVNGEIGKGVFRRFIAVEIHPHQLGVAADEGRAARQFLFGVEGLGQGRGCHTLAHLFNANGNCQTGLAAGHGKVGHAQGGGPGSRGRFHLQRFNAVQSSLIGNQGGHVLLSLKLVAQHVAGEQGLHPLHPGICHGLARRQRAQLAQTTRAGFDDFNLADPNDAYRANGHLTLF